MACLPIDDRAAAAEPVDAREHLRARVRSALAMARTLLDEVLDPRFADEDPDRYRALASKAGCELAMLLRMARHALPDRRDGDEIRALAHRLAPIARSPQVTRSLVMRPSRATMYALAHLCLAELGVADEAVHRVVRLALRSSAAAAHERVPYRLLDAAWTRHLVFGDGELDHPAILLSPLGAGVDLIEASTEDAYAFSHALPYATDFGRVPLPDGVPVRTLLQIAEALAVKALDDDDLDLLAELLMAPAILRLGWTPTLAFAWQVLDRVWSEHGFVPGPGLPDPVSGETRSQTVRRVLGTTYHTTFAAGLCCATLICCGVAPPVGDTATPGSSELPLGKGTAWKLSWTACTRRQQDDLSFLRLAFALRRAVDAVDFVRVRDVVMTAARQGLLEHALFNQALELLERAGAASVQ